MARGFTHLDYEQRLKIEKMLDEGVSKYRIADELGMDPSSIYREIKRGLRDGRYDPDYSNQKYQNNLREKGPVAKLEENKEFAEYIANMILNHSMSPKRIVETLKQDHRFSNWDISIPTIYENIDKGRIPGVTRDSLKKDYATVFSEGQICIPKWVMEQLNIKDGDRLRFEVTEDGKIVYQKEEYNGTEY
uniref:helix-turn-helix domain-containing protein n=1 Tax=Faecalibacterium sp. TaxID=1971605 RepID=UPI003FEE89AB